MVIDLNSLIVNIFVNDIKIIGIKGSGITQRVKTKLAPAFLIVDISPINFYLGLKILSNKEKKILKLL